MRKALLSIITAMIIAGVYNPGLSFGVKGESRNKMIPWEQARKILPRYSTFTVVDLETGKKFRVQRRAGSRHADVQPLTAKDTKIMKNIYSGSWSWKRRAIFILKGNKKIAASMNGMPHGAGALQNNFPGHFCIHFYGSSTHRRSEMDFSHKLMILKSAGQLEGYLGKSDPYEAARVFLTGFKERDKKIVSVLALQKANWPPILKNINNVAILRIPILPAEDLEGELTVLVTADVEWLIKGEGRRVVKGEIRMVRLSPYDPWKVDTKHFLKEYGFSNSANSNH